MKTESRSTECGHQIVFAKVVSCFDGHGVNAKYTHEKMASQCHESACLYFSTTHSVGATHKILQKLNKVD